MYQNENLSVRVLDEFMQATIDDKPKIIIKRESLMTVIRNEIRI